jgi:polyketide biosynthesis 3-hydroxy-3-methylglutaryl-CoA synthase-like enzyme PksG
VSIGIEAMNAYGGEAFVDVKALFEHRRLDMERYHNLLMDRKAVGLPCEDAVTNAVNAAKPLVDAMSEEDKRRIELVLTSTETSVDFGKSLSTYVHDYLGLSRRCRLIEVKQACYAGTAAFQMAANFIAGGASPGAKALVIATDMARAGVKGTYAEPSQGTGAVALVVGERPEVLELDFGANGYHGYEIMDTCRPEPEIETGDWDLSLLSYLDCLEGSFKVYEERVEGADFQSTFDYLAFHTPFAGMVRGAHRRMMRRLKRFKTEEIEADYQRRVRPSLTHCMQVGNIYSATVFLALCGVIEGADTSAPRRVGIFSYGSGCSSEFYSGVITRTSRQALLKQQLAERLAGRYELSMDEYDRVIELNRSWMFGIKDKEMDLTPFSRVYASQMEQRGRLVLKGIRNYHREYDWA